MIAAPVLSVWSLLRMVGTMRRTGTIRLRDSVGVGIWGGVAVYLNLHGGSGPLAPLSWALLALIPLIAVVALVRLAVGARK
ncbi:hypothetical protein ACIRBX_27040 [Kitasatospora sp. NPDC096147]|uniref:hypothetical protein n=1 Tax=Kitasatospora sp. NPDC096147 TaxID=3364093 RepID=UPI003827C54F